MEKRKSIVSYNKLPEDLKIALEQQYPFGIEKGLIDMKDQHGVAHKAIMLQSEEHIYLVKMTKKEVLNVVEGYSNEDLAEETNLPEILEFDGDDLESDHS